jgi:hypothetical protein
VHFAARRLGRTVAKDAGKMNGRDIDALINHQFYG